MHLGSAAGAALTEVKLPATMGAVSNIMNRITTTLKYPPLFVSWGFGLAGGTGRVRWRAQYWQTIAASGISSEQQGQLFMAACFLWSLTTLIT